MTHPLTKVGTLKDNELEDKIIDLSSRYWKTTNPEVQQQIMLILDDYRQELSARRAKQQVKEQNGENDLDNLINIS
tara:strand:- start:158 stop:385 length:228 start_codon:yes stop_codon:yes gene_type:complete